jgi:hypothetical protein
MNEALEAAKKAVAKLEMYTREIQTIRAALEEQFPEAFQALREAEKAVPIAQEEAKVALRELGSGTHQVGDHFITVGSAPQKIEVDSIGLIERARDRGELGMLLEYGVLSYSVQAHQVPRLPSLQAATYNSFMRATTGTRSVTLPPALKP